MFSVLAFDTSSHIALAVTFPHFLCCSRPAQYAFAPFFMFQAAELLPSGPLSVSVCPCPSVRVRLSVSACPSVRVRLSVSVCPCPSVPVRLSLSVCPCLWLFCQHWGYLDTSMVECWTRIRDKLDSNSAYGHCERELLTLIATQMKFN